MSETTDKIVKELGYDIRVKPYTKPSKTPTQFQERDFFQTPRYAVELLIPYIPEHITTVWESSCGDGRIVKILIENGYSVYPSDIRKSTGWVDNHIYNFVDYSPENFPSSIKTSIERGTLAVITNPPFSIKELFIERAIDYGIPFAFLVNADYSGTSIEWIRRGCEKVIPTSRISYITPNILKRIHEGEIWNEIKKSVIYSGLGELKQNDFKLWENFLEEYKDLHNYSSIDETPQELLYKYSSAQFHSMWLTYGFSIGKTETFVDLTSEQRRNIL